jgi:hypothetical protein
VATSLLPSAEEATLVQGDGGTLLVIQVVPELVEVKIGPLTTDPVVVVGVAPTTATNLFPSAEEATAIKFLLGMLFDIQSMPTFVEV